MPTNFWSTNHKVRFDEDTVITTIIQNNNHNHDAVNMGQSVNILDTDNSWIDNLKHPFTWEFYHNVNHRMRLDIYKNHRVSFNDSYQAIAPLKRMMWCLTEVFSPLGKRLMSRNTSICRSNPTESPKRLSSSSPWSAEWREAPVGSGQFKQKMLVILWETNLISQVPHKHL